jgi:hypothetical protein
MLKPFFPQTQKFGLLPKDEREKIEVMVLNLPDSRLLFGGGGGNNKIPAAINC